MIILDTNVLSALMQFAPDEVVADWLDRQPALSIWTTAITILELRIGIAMLAPGRRQTQLEAAFSGLLAERLTGRVLPFDAASADVTADLVVQRERTGMIVGERDTLIAGITLSRRAVIATRNVKDFRDLEPRVVNPWDPR
ncbi:MAG: type II toxin-antitoxin system VapC family toxin [Thermomicrobiales bacterium]